MQKDEIDVMVAHMNCAMALDVMHMVSTVNQLGFDIPEEFEPVRMAAIAHFMEEGYLDVAVCEHGEPSMKYTQKFRDITESVEL